MRLRTRIAQASLSLSQLIYCHDHGDPRVLHGFPLAAVSPCWLASLIVLGVLAAIASVDASTSALVWLVSCLLGVEDKT